MPRDIFFHDPRDHSERDYPTLPARTPRRSTDGSPQLEEREQNNEPRPDSISFFAFTRKPEALDSPRAYYLGEQAYFLRESEVRTLGEIGAFRAVAAEDLGRLGYAGDTRRMEREIRRLRDQTLVSEKTVLDRKRSLRLVALTRKGARLAENSEIVPPQQVLFHGFVRPRDAKHDADLYRLYHAEAERITRARGRITRIVLDDELKSTLNRDLAFLSPEEQPSREARERIARRHGLTVVQEKIAIPDIRIEYDNAEMERESLDLELATRNYRSRALAEKAEAGFSFYAPREDAPRIRRVLDQLEISAEILSL
jgi:hypothetical protein